MEIKKLPKFICDEFVTTSDPKISPWKNALVVPLTLSRQGVPTEAATFQSCSQGHGAIQLHHWLQFLFHLESGFDFFPWKCESKNMGTWIECIYIYIYQLVNIYIYISCAVYVCVEYKHAYN